MAAPGWYPDPTGRHQLRWWGGVSWMAAVRDGATQGSDPVGVARPVVNIGPPAPGASPLTHTPAPAPIQIPAPAAPPGGWRRDGFLIFLLDLFVYLATPVVALVLGAVTLWLLFSGMPNLLGAPFTALAALYVLYLGATYYSS